MARLEKELHTAHTILDVQGKLAGLLGFSLEAPEGLLMARPAARISGRLFAGVLSAGGATGLMLPSSEARSRASAAPSYARPGIACVRTRACPRRDRQPVLRRPAPQAEVIVATVLRWRQVSVGRAHDVPDPGREPAGARAEQSVQSALLDQASRRWRPSACQTWSCDIARLRGIKRWTSFDLYVLLDIFSRYVVGWMVAARENAAACRDVDRGNLSRARFSSPRCSPCIRTAPRR